MKKKAVIWGYFENNLGDDLMLQTFLDNCGMMYDEIYINSKKEYADYYSKMGVVSVKTNTLLYRIFNRIVLKLRSVELFYLLSSRQRTDFIMLGGSLFAEESEKQTNQQMQNLTFAINHAEAAYVIGSNFGPYKHSSFVEAYATLFRKCSDVCFRDMYSYERFSSLPTVRYAPDVVLSGNWVCKKENSDTVVVSLIDIRNRENLSQYADNYEDFIITMCKEFISEGSKILLVPMCEFEGDVIISERIKDLLANDNPGCVSIVEYTSLETILHVFATAKKIVATRFHAMILGQYFEKPTISIPYSEKVVRAIEAYNVECLIIPINEISRESILECLTYNKCSETMKLKREAKGHYSKILGGENRDT